MLVIGLSWYPSLRRYPRSTYTDFFFRRRQALSCIALGYFIISVVMVLNGTIGARLHIAFPVLNRSSFGFWFSYFTVFSRIILAMFWFAIQASHLLHHYIIASPAYHQTVSLLLDHNAYIR